MRDRKVIFLDVAVLERRRLEAGLLRGELCERAGISRTSGHRAWRRGHVGVVVARKLAAALGVDLKELWGDGGGSRHG